MFVNDEGVGADTLILRAVGTRTEALHTIPLITVVKDPVHQLVGQAVVQHGCAPAPPKSNKKWLQLRMKEAWYPTFPHGYSLEPPGPQPLIALRDMRLTNTQDKTLRHFHRHHSHSWHQRTHQ